MSKILNITNELVITYSWDTIADHGICGHTYEAIDYYIVLKDHFDCILFLPELNYRQLITILHNKYYLTEVEMDNIIDKCIFGIKPLLLKCRNILFVDGGITRINNLKILADKKILFACGDKSIKDNNDKSIFILQDNRIYEPVCTNGINYVKKILFSKLKPITKSKDKILLYLTSNCRSISDEVLKTITKEENKYLIIGNITSDLKNIEIIEPPVYNLFEEFSTYIYTPVARQWDCSPRLIAECKFYNKEVQFFNINYLDIDTGLNIRIQDIKNNFESLFLKHDDEIIKIVKEII